MTHKIAVVATDLHPMYAFFAPITALMWRHVVGYESNIVCVGTGWGDSPIGYLVLEAMADQELTGRFNIPCPPGYRTANMAQIARLYGWMDADLDDYVIVSDVDMWPLDRGWFESRRPPPRSMSIMYANNRTRFPICYVGADAFTWQSMLEQDEAADTTICPSSYEEPFHRRLVSHMLTHLKPETNAQDAWQHDEDWLTSKIQHWSGYPESVNFYNRHAGEPPADRLDRAAWSTFSPGIHADAHLLRPGYTRDNWPRLRDLIARVAPSILGWADDYAAAYTRALG